MVLFFPKSKVKAFWTCTKYKTHVWPDMIAFRTRRTNCPYCTGKRVSKQNSFVINCPDLVEEFDYKKNINIKLNQIVCGSLKKAWWLCKYCNKSWNVSFYTRTRRGNKKPGCSDCKKLKKFRSVSD